MSEAPESEDAWLRFFLRRLRFGLDHSKSPEVQAMLQEVISVAEERLDRLEPWNDPHPAGR